MFRFAARHLLRPRVAMAGTGLGAVAAGTTFQLPAPWQADIRLCAGSMSSGAAEDRTTLSDLLAGREPNIRRCNQVLPARKLQPDVATCSIAMRACAQGTQWVYALQLLFQMPKYLVRPNTISFNTGMSACTNSGHWERAWDLVASMRHAGIAPDSTGFNTCTNVCASAGAWGAAVSLLAQSVLAQASPDVIGFNSALKGCAVAEAWQPACHLLRQMPEKLVRPSARSYSSSITATLTWTRALDLGAPRLASESVVCRNGVAAATRAGVWALAAALLAALCHEEVRRKNKQLREQLSKTPWPILKCFSSNGQNYSLPLRAQSRDLAHLRSESRLAYMSGFFDGDGCVTWQGLSGCCLGVAQSFDQAAVLMLFYETLGGSVTLLGRGRGLGKPTLLWRAYGQSARQAAQLLAPHSITKRKQLMLAAQWPDAKSRRESSKAELRALKEYDSAVAGPCSWEYFGGFFDAEGYINQQRGGACLVLEIRQKHPRVLKCLRAFLARSLGKDAKLTKSGGSAHILWVYGMESCKQILQRLLATGLLCKAEQAKLVVGLTAETAAQVNAELGSLTGNQNFGRSLDAAGRQRARKIAGVRNQARRLKQHGQLAEAEAKLVEVMQLKQEHELLKATHENQQLLEYMYKLQSLHQNSWEGQNLPRKMRQKSVLTPYALKPSCMSLALSPEVEPNIVSFGGAVGLGPWPHAAALAAAATSVGLRPTVVLYNSIANACGEDGRWSAALLALEDMIQVSTTPTIVTYNCLIRASAQQGLWEHSLEILQARVRAAPSPDWISFNSAIAALSEVYEWPRALDLLQHMEKRKLLPDTVTYNSVLNICAQAGGWMAAVAVFDRMTRADVQPNEISYSSLLSACDKGSRWQLALSVLRSLRLGEVLPGIMSFNSAVNACGRGGLAYHFLGFRFRSAVRSVRVRQLRDLSQHARSTESWWWSGTTAPLQHLPHGDVEKLAAHPADKVEEVGRKNLQLRNVLKTIHWRKLTCFEANGQIYDLPLPVLRQAGACMNTLEDATVRFLAGFFDGDGCVACQESLSGCYLTVEQCFDRVDILMLFRKSFGGSITSHRGGVGLQKPVLRWQAYGQLARMAARLMAPYSITKHKQLRLASKWPAARSCKLEFHSELRSLKRYDSAVAGTCSWEYVAGFFDADGYIGLRHRGEGSIFLEIKQKHPSVLECLRIFLERSPDVNVPFPKVRAVSQAHCPRITGLLVCKQLLKKMLTAGLLVKAKQANLVASLTKQNAASIRAQLADLTGNQSFSKRLDSAGRERARKIQYAQGQAARFSRRGQKQEADFKLNEIEALQNEHVLMNARLENQRLLEYLYGIRKACTSNDEGHWWRFLSLLCSLPRPDAVTYSSGLAACALSAAWQMTVALLKEIPKRQLATGLLCYISVLSACQRRLGSWSSQRAQYPLNEGAWDVASFNNAVGVCARAGRWRHAMNVFDTMFGSRYLPDAISFGSSIRALAEGSKWAEVLELLAAMDDSALHPELITYSFSMAACNRGGQYHQSFRVLASMASRRLCADVVALGCGLEAAEITQNGVSAAHLAGEIHRQNLQALAHSAARCHCQVPCGIFHDDGRIAMILEDAMTIRKAVVQCQDLHKSGKLQD
ncbi:unnamed protein product [Symbiodinium sp. KB8]|nr:unnamed protein product [Symbiodinium sp. KB8]